MDSIQKRTEAQIEAVAEKHGYTVTRDATYSNVGTFRFHAGDDVESLHTVFYDFQRGYVSFMIDSEIKQSFGYEADGVNGRTISMFLAALEDELTSPETLEVTAGREDTGVFAGSTGSLAGEIAGKNAGWGIDDPRISHGGFAGRRDAGSGSLAPCSICGGIESDGIHGAGFEEQGGHGYDSEDADVEVWENGTLTNDEIEA